MPPATLAGATPQGSILVVDDQPANLRAVSALLTRHGYDVRTAGHGEEALQMATAQVPDLLLLDMMMPGMDGFELLAHVKEHAELRKLPAIFLTAAQDRDMLLRAFEAGAVDYVTKPFIPEELLARVTAHIGLKLTRDRLERVAHQRQELVNLVAHDLKNPLSSVLFASDVLRNAGCKPERVPRYLEMIHESVGDALGYIRRYLETQAHRASGQKPASATTTLNEVLEWLVQRYELQLESRGLRMQLSMPAVRCHVAIDGLVLRQVAENLVNNAMKYAPGSAIELSIRSSAPGFWQLLVEDRGPGVSPVRQHQLFKPFTRLTDTDPADGLSSGLGLSLAKQILSGYEGNLWYEDREGGGARFVIELPAASEPDAP
ncbi:hybrid sensor histidine kinase/response regulator [Luteimonas sp. 8-5]|uniref:hybrid sensor histidine kinase/response regulator n=1 Tax=Luteimonas sp. 8-5 TaxID=3039387 RepID=UPI00243633D5|nr:hybrid sensor histidine kinase/response regulator [Luteimonas sp. 8-5]MDG6347272.1 hybrid sensor histidine kinase/response regulator [Luteimonas sp. 8-5]